MIIWSESLWKCLSYSHLYEGVLACTACVKHFSMYLRTPCLDVNKSMFSIWVLKKYLASLLTITAGILLKFSNVCHYQCWLYEKFNKPTIVQVIKNDDIIKMHGTQYFRLILQCIFIVILVPTCSFVFKQLMYDTLMLGTECVQNSFKIKYINDPSCLFPATGFVVVILYLSVGVTRVLHEIQLNTDIY